MLSFGIILIIESFSPFLIPVAKVIGLLLGSFMLYFGTLLIVELLSQFSDFFERILNILIMPTELADRIYPYIRSLLYPFFSLVILFSIFFIFLIPFNKLGLFHSDNDRIIVYLFVCFVTISYSRIGNLILKMIKMFEKGEYLLSVSEDISPYFKDEIKYRNRAREIPYEVATKIFNQDNFRVTSYFFYFLLMILFSVVKFSTIDSLYLKQILYIEPFVFAFITFIAFDRAFPYCPKPNKA